jgi:hypothetical protein
MNPYLNNSKVNINFSSVPDIDEVINLTETSLGLTMNIIFKETRLSAGQSSLPGFIPEDNLHPDRWIGFVSTHYRTAFITDYNTTNNFYVLAFSGVVNTGIGSVEIFATFNNAVFTVSSNTTSADITITNTTTNAPPTGGGLATLGNQILLNWDGASDDIGIKGYEIVYNIEGSPTWNSVPMIYRSVAGGSYSFNVTTQLTHNFGIRTVDTSNQKSQYVYLTVPVTPNILISSTALDDNNSACGLLTPSIIILLFNGVASFLTSTTTPIINTYVQYPDDGSSSTIIFDGTISGSPKFWKILSNGTYYSCKIDSTGKILSVANCSSLPIPKTLSISAGLAAVNNAPPSTMCSAIIVDTVYYMGTSLVVGTIINNNTNGLSVSNPFSGGNKYYLLADNTITQVAKISSNPAGKVTELLTYTSLNCPVGTGGGCCFLPGTKITLFSGVYINIEDLIGGEVVLTYNIEKKTFEKGMVSKIFKPLHNDVIKLIIEDTIIDCTSTHPFWSVNKGKWVSLNPKETLLSMNIDIEQLEEGDVLLNERNEEVVLNDIIIIESEDIITYDISVEPNNTYYTNGILVHNKLIPPADPIIN